MSERASQKAKAEIESFMDDDGDAVYVLDIEFAPDSSFEDKIKLMKDSGYDDFLYTGLGSNEGITDKNMEEYLWGQDVMDHLELDSMETEEEIDGLEPDMEY